MAFHRFAEISGHSAGVYSLAFDGLYIYSASADRYIARWNPLTGTQDKFAVQCDYPVYSIELIRSGSILLAGLNSGDIHVIDLIKREEIKFIKQHRSAVFCLTYNSITDQWYSSDSDGNLAVWSADTFELLAFFPLNCGKIRRIAVNGDGTQLALACQDGIIRLFDTTYFNEITSFTAHENGVTSISFDSNFSDRLWSGGKDAMLKIWKVTTNELIKEIPAHNYVIYDFLEIPSQHIMITASRDKTMKIWDKKELNFVQRIDNKTGGHRHSVNALVSLDDGKWASASDDKRIMIWGETDFN